MPPPHCALRIPQSAQECSRIFDVTSNTQWDREGSESLEEWAQENEFPLDRVLAYHDSLIKGDVCLSARDLNLFLRSGRSQLRMPFGIGTQGCTFLDDDRALIESFAEEEQSRESQNIRSEQRGESSSSEDENSDDEDSDSDDDRPLLVFPRRLDIPRMIDSFPVGNQYWEFRQRLLRPGNPWLEVSFPENLALVRRLILDGDESLPASWVGPPVNPSEDVVQQLESRMRMSRDLLQSFDRGDRLDDNTEWRLDTDHGFYELGAIGTPWDVPYDKPWLFSWILYPASMQRMIFRMSPFAGGHVFGFPDWHGRSGFYAAPVPDEKMVLMAAWMVYLYTLELSLGHTREAYQYLRNLRELSPQLPRRHRMTHVGVDDVLLLVLASRVESGPF